MPQRLPRAAAACMADSLGTADLDTGQRPAALIRGLEHADAAKIPGRRRTPRRPATCPPPAPAAPAAHAPRPGCRWRARAAPALGHARAR